MQVKAFKLTTGDEIIAYAEQGARSLIEGGGPVIASEGWRLSKIRAVQLTANPGGGIGFAFFPWIACNPDMETALPPSMIAFEVTPLKAIEDAYIAQTSVVKPASVMPPGISSGIQR